MKRSIITAVSFGSILFAGIAAAAVAATSTNTSVPSLNTAKEVAQENHIHGQVIYSQDIVVPPQATLLVQLLDTTKSDRPSKVVTEARNTLNGQVPANFSLSITTQDLQKDHTYALQARISVGDALWFVTEVPMPVEHDRSGYLIRLAAVVQNNNITMRKNDIRGRVWVAEDINNNAIVGNVRISMKIDDTALAKPVSFSNSAETAQYYSVSGTGGCNRFFSNVTLDENSNMLKFDPLGMTFMACTDPVNIQESRFTDMMSKVRSYRLENDGFLYLIDVNNTAIGRFSQEN